MSLNYVSELPVGVFKRKFGFKLWIPWLQTHLNFFFIHLPFLANSVALFYNFGKSWKSDPGIIKATEEQKKKVKPWDMSNLIFSSLTPVGQSSLLFSTWSFNESLYNKKSKMLKSFPFTCHPGFFFYIWNVCASAYWSKVTFRSFWVTKLQLWFSR